MRWDLRGPYSFRLRVNNLLDEEYESFGYVDWTTPLFIPAAGRSFIAMVTMEPSR